MTRIAVVPGDGIGPEVTQEGQKLLEVLNAKYRLGLECDLKLWNADAWLKTGIGLPKGAIEDLRQNYQAIYFGALGDPRIPDMAHGREILLGLRFGLDLFVNMRPVQLMSERHCPLKGKTKQDVDFVVFRENTEDVYVGMGGNFKKGTPDEVSIDESIHTRKGVERIIRQAFEYAKKNNRQKVTLGDKANAIGFGGGLWQRVFREVAAEFSSIRAEHLYVDVMAMEFVRNPERFDVIVTSNLFGDILTDLGAGLTGGLGLSASANIHPGKMGLFEPVHGSAPDIVGQGKANPMAAFLTAALMLDYLKMNEPAKTIRDAVVLALEEGIATPDLGGSMSTQQVSDFVCEKCA